MGQPYCEHVVVKRSDSGAGWSARDARRLCDDGYYFHIEPSANDLRGLFCNCNQNAVAQVELLSALRSADPQTLPEHIAKLVADWKAGT